MVAWTAAARWFARAHMMELAVASLMRYRVLSLQLTGGVDPDTLGLVSDLMKKKWYLNPQYQKYEGKDSCEKEAA